MHNSIIPPTYWHVHKHGEKERNSKPNYYFFKYKIKTFLAAKETARQRESDREKRNLRYLQVAQLRRSAHERFPNQRQKAVEISWESQLP